MAEDVDKNAKAISSIRGYDSDILGFLKVLKTDIKLLEELVGEEKKELNEIKEAENRSNKTIAESLTYSDMGSSSNSEINSRESLEIESLGNTNTEIKKLYDSIFDYGHILIPNFDKLIELFEEEFKELNSYFNRNESDRFRFLSQLVQIIVKNGEQIKAIVDYIKGYIPALSKLDLELVGYMDKVDNTLATEYFGFYLDFIKLLGNPGKNNSKNFPKGNFYSILSHLEILLGFLKGIYGTNEGLDGQFNKDFISLLEKEGIIGLSKENKKNGIIFAKNGFDIDLLNNSYETIKSFLKKYSGENGGINLINNEIPEKEVKELSSLLNGILKRLFSGFKNLEDYEKSIDKILPKKKSETKELKNKYIEIRNLVNTQVNKDDNFIDMRENPIPSINFLKIHFDGLDEGETITFNKFEEEYLNDSNEESVKSVINILTDILGGAKNKDGAYEKFLNLQKKLGIVKGDASNNGGGGKLTQSDYEHLRNQIVRILNLLISGQTVNLTEEWNSFYSHLFGELSEGEFKNEKLTSFCKLHYVNLDSRTDIQIKSVLLEASYVQNVSISEGKITNLEKLKNLLNSINILLDFAININGSI